jgi:hypothetical protein
VADLEGVACRISPAVRQRAQRLWKRDVQISSGFKDGTLQVQLCGGAIAGSHAPARRPKP